MVGSNEMTVFKISVSSHLHHGVLFATSCIALLTTSSLGSIFFKCAQNYLVGKMNTKPARQTMILVYVFLHHTGRKACNF